MDIVMFVIDQKDRFLASSTRTQAMTLGTVGAKMFVNTSEQSMEDICRRIAQRFRIGSSDRLVKLHICAHGNASGRARQSRMHRGPSLVEMGRGLTFSNTEAFRRIRWCFVNTGRAAPGANIEMNVCDAAGTWMAPLMQGLANAAGVPVRACPEPILIARMFHPAAGFQCFPPASGHAVSEADYVDVEGPIPREIRQLWTSAAR